jgi:uncharacterized RDD family membrane protein YckC
MNIWIIRDGEKIGPFPDYEIRQKINDGELNGATPAWHEGLTDWATLEKIAIFTRDFEEPTPQVKTAAQIPSTSPPPLPQPTAYMRRFWARWLDLSLYSGFWLIGMWAAGQDIKGVILSPWIIFLHYVPWFLMEAVLLHYFGTTLGKWLLGLRVVNQDGSKLDLTAATKRSLWVMAIGIGFGWPLLKIFCQILSFSIAKQLGATFWDHLGKHRVMVAPLNPFRLIALVFLFAASIFLELIVVFPYMHEINPEAMPAFKEFIEENPLWHLPKRSK